MPMDWVDPLTKNQSMEISTEPTFNSPDALVLSIPVDSTRQAKDFDVEPDLQLPVVSENEVWFWRFQDQQGKITGQSGFLLIVPSGSSGRWISFGGDFNSKSQWVIKASRVYEAAVGGVRDSSEKSGDAVLSDSGEKTYFVTGNSLSLVPQTFAVQYRVYPADGATGSKKAKRDFSGLKVGKTVLTAALGWKVDAIIHPQNATQEPEFVGPLGSIVDVREPTRESISSVSLLGRYLVEDLSIQRDLVFDVRSAKSIGGALRVADVAFYPASIFADFEWHGVTASYDGAPSGEPPEVIKHVFGGFSVGYDLGQFFPRLEQNQFALHVGPQFSVASVPISNDFEPRGFVGVRIQPQWIRFGSVWQGTIEYAARKSSHVSRFSAGYVTCKYFEICLSGEVYLRDLVVASGSDETKLTENGLGLGVGINL